MILIVSKVFSLNPFKFVLLYTARIVSKNIYKKQNDKQMNTLDRQLSLVALEANWKLETAGWTQFIKRCIKIVLIKKENWWWRRGRMLVLLLCPHLSSAPRPCASVTTRSNLKGGLAINPFLFDYWFLIALLNCQQVS